jgi:hypothetical protein
LFDVLKRGFPEHLKKLVPISGDCMEVGLGLSPSDRQMLEQKVSIIFHAAASVRFDDTLKYATIMNTRGTREVMLLARKMKSLKVSLFIIRRHNLWFCHTIPFHFILNLQDMLTYYSLTSGELTRPQSTSSQL